MALATLQGANVPITMWARPEEVEPAALDQLKRIAALPWTFSHIAVMPDVHLGKGATVGSVIAMRDALSPSAVGVDIGCGMAAVATNLTAADLPEDLKGLRTDVEAAIPVGFAQHEDISREVDGYGLWGGFAGLSPKVQDRLGKAMRQMGSLGGGNHFIELCLDGEDRVWIMLHSGSRNIGKELAEVHIGIAKQLPHNADLPDRDLAVFVANTPEMTAYRNDLMWAQEYARLNRATMLRLYMDVVRRHLPQVVFDEPISCHHNYVAQEHHYGTDVLVTRKGAIRAGVGDLGIIPGSMGTSSFIVRGLGNPESFESASHGAGRRMSRNEARRRFTVADLEAQTAGIESRKDAGVLDELPAAYKDIDQVMANQADLVEIVARLRQVMVVKG
ncbi:MAG TPA: RtcB family protein [Actinomycetes bacterium]|nr:RtcB family protein [Actinomycetes bacterium]